MDKEIDVIYIVTPHPYHKQLSIMCLQHKKAVLCEKPAVLNVAEIGRTGVDEQGTAILVYNDGKLADLSFAISTDTENIGYIYGTDGYIRIPYYWRAREAVLIKNNEEHIIKPEFIGNGYNYEIEEVNNCLREGKIQSKRVSWNRSKEVIEIMDELRRQWNLIYPTELHM